MSLFQQVHTQIRSAGSILTIGFLEREEGRNDSKMWCFLLNKGQPELNSWLVTGGWALPYRFWPGWKKGNWKQAASGASSGSTGPILTGCCARLLPHPSLIFNKNMPYCPPYRQLKEQEAGSPGTRILWSPARHAPHSFRRNSTPKDTSIYPLATRGAAKGKMQNYMG